MQYPSRTDEIHGVDEISCEMKSDSVGLKKEPKGEKMEEKHIEKIKKYRLDIIVIAAILALSLSVLLFVTLTKEEGSVAVVRIDDGIVAKIPLDTDGEYPLNGGTNTLTVKDGVAYMSYSECKGHQCEKMGKIRHVGEFIECAPNHIKIVITGDSDDGVDLVS